MSTLMRAGYVAVLCGLALQSPTTSGSALAAVLAVLVVAMATCQARVAATIAPLPTGCAARAACTPPAPRLHQLVPDAAGHPQPRAPGRRTAVASA